MLVACRSSTSNVETQEGWYGDEKEEEDEAAGMRSEVPSHAIGFPRAGDARHHLRCGVVVAFWNYIYCSSKNLSWVLPVSSVTVI